MDPTETLRLLDEARADLRVALSTANRDDAIEAADRVQLHAGNLRHWLVRDGFLPAERPTTRDRVVALLQSRQADCRCGNLDPAALVVAVVESDR